MRDRYPLMLVLVVVTVGSCGGKSAPPSNDEIIATMKAVLDGGTDVRIDGRLASSRELGNATNFKVEHVKLDTWFVDDDKKTHYMASAKVDFDVGNLHCKTGLSLYELDKAPKDRSPTAVRNGEIICLGK